MNKKWLGVPLAAIVIGGALAVNAYTGGSGDADSNGRTPGTAKLVQAADLQRCPADDQHAVVADGGLPDVTLPCLGDGPAVTLSKLRGKPLVVNIWAGPCPPCKREAPLIERFHRAAGTRVTVLGVVYGPYPGESVDDALDAARGLGMSYPSVFDSIGKVLQGLGGQGIPVTVLVDPDGSIVHVKRGELGQGQLPSLVDRYLGVSVDVPSEAPSAVPPPTSGPAR